MPEDALTFERTAPAAIVSLQIARGSADDAAERLRLADALKFTARNPMCAWIAPGRWLLVSEDRAPESLVTACNTELQHILHAAVDQTAAWSRIEIRGRRGRELLAAGCGLDLRPASFGVGACARTRLAQIAVVVVARQPGVDEVYVDRSYERYLLDWMSDANAAMVLATEN